MSVKIAFLDSYLEFYREAGFVRKLSTVAVRSAQQLLLMFNSWCEGVWALSNVGGGSPPTDDEKIVAFRPSIFSPRNWVQWKLFTCRQQFPIAIILILFDGGVSESR